MMKLCKSFLLNIERKLTNCNNVVPNKYENEIEQGKISEFYLILR